MSSVAIPKPTVSINFYQNLETSNMIDHHKCRKSYSVLVWLWFSSSNNMPLAIFNSRAGFMKSINYTVKEKKNA